MSSIYQPGRKLSSVDFDLWRQNYHAMTYEEHVAFHSRIWRDYPEQKHFNIEATHHFFDNEVDAPDVRVLEIGGWTGDVAREMLLSDPQIDVWHNVELCKEAAQAGNADKDLRLLPYGAVVLDDWIWHLDPRAALFGCAVLYMSHSIEHMTGENVRQLFSRVMADNVYIDAPLEEHDQDWRGYVGTHILEWGWTSLIRELAVLGFALTGTYGQAHFFRRA